MHVFVMFFIKVKKHVFVFYLQINVFNIYSLKLVCNFLLVISSNLQPKPSHTV